MIRIPVLAVAAILLAPQAQEQVVQVRVSTPDGQVVAGVPSIASVKLESSMGTVDLPLANLASIKLDGEKAVVAGADRTVLKGKLLLDEFKVAGHLGELTMKKGSFTVVEIFKSVLRPVPKPVSAQLPVMVQVRTTDGNELNGHADSGVISCETTLGKFDIDVARLDMLGREKEGHALVLLDGTRLHGKVRLSDLTVRTGMGVFTLKLENIETIQNRGWILRDRQPDPAPGPKTPPSGPAAPPPPSPPKAPGLEPQCRTKIRALFSPFRISKDGSTAYAINRSEAKLCRWKLPGLEDAGTLPLTGLEKTLAIDPAGGRLFAAGERMVTVISMERFAVQKTFSVEVQIDVACALDGDTLVTGGPAGTALISVSRSAVLQKFMGNAQRILVAGNRVFTPGVTLIVAKDAAGNPRLEQIHDPSMGYTQSSPTAISPDGRFGTSILDGRLLRLGRCWVASRVVLRDLERHTASAFTPDSRYLHLFTPDGFLKVLEAPDFKVQSSHFLGVRVFHAEVGPDGKFVLVYGAGVEPQGQGRNVDRGGPLEPTPGDLYRFEIPKN